MIERKFSLFCSARPPETMILAEVSSGRSDLLIFWPMKVAPPASPAYDTASISPVPPSRATFSKLVPRTVMTSLASLDLTVAIALPA